MQQNGVERRADARENRLRVIEAAKEIFAEKGIVAAEMKEIAERAGVGVGTIYRNFPNKDDLIGEIVREVIGEVERAVERAEAHEDAVTGLRDLLADVFDVVQRYGWLADAVFSEQLPESVKAEIETKQSERGESGFHRIMRGAIVQGSVRRDVDVDLAVAILAGTFAPWSLFALLAERSPDELADEILDLCMRGWASHR